MADEQNEKATSSKRVRLSSEGQNDFLDDKTKIQYLDENFSRTNLESVGKQYVVNDETFEPTVYLSDQYGNGNDYELQEKEDSNDFPPCFSVEDVLDDEEQHHFQPVAGKCVNTFFSCCYSNFRPNFASAILFLICSKSRNDYMFF